MMTSGIDWPIAYGGFALGTGLIGWVTYWALRQAERREAGRQQEAAVPEHKVRQGRRRAA